MQEQPVAPPPPDQTKQPATDVHDEHAVTQAEGEGMPPVASEAQPPAEQPQTAQPGTDAAEGQQQMSPAMTAVSALIGGGDAAEALPPPTEPPPASTEGEAQLPQIPDFDTIVPTVRTVILAEGIPEAVFARDLVIPIEEREPLIRKVSKALTGIDVPAEANVARRAEGIATVGDLIDFFEEGHPDHPTQQGEPFEQSER